MESIFKMEMNVIFHHQLREQEGGSQLIEIESDVHKPIEIK